MTPAHRLGLLAALAGGLLFAYGVSELSPFTDTLDCIGSPNKGCAEVRWGFALVIAGFLLAPVLKWVWHGKAR